MKLGANTVLFGGYDMDTAFRCLAMAGYDGVELSAIGGMSEHLMLDRWQELVPEIKGLSQTYGLELLAMEQPSQDVLIMEAAFQAAAEIGIPIVNCGPGGTTGDQESLQKSIDSLGHLAEMAGKYGVTLCVKAHVGAAIYNTETTLKVMDAINLPSFGIDMDPSHIHRAGENPVEALQAVVSRVKHVHIRDCKEPSRIPGNRRCKPMVGAISIYSDISECLPKTIMRDRWTSKSSEPKSTLSNSVVSSRPSREDICRLAFRQPETGRC